jgi:hypothetical protein
MSVKTRKSLLKTLVIVTLVVLCGGVNIANAAGNLGYGSYYLLLSNIYAANAQKDGTYGLYLESNGYDPSSYLYNAYIYM